MIPVEGFSLLLPGQSLITSHVSRTVFSLRTAANSGGAKHLCRMSQNAMEENISIEHREVPSGHQSLHDALYGDGDDHGAAEQDVLEDFALSDVSISVTKFLELASGKRLAGVFSISGPDDRICFISYSRNLFQTISGTPDFLCTRNFFE
jgi:hypothetical protein